MGIAHSLFIHSSIWELLGDCQTLALLNRVAFEHSCASWFSKVLTPIYTLTRNESESLQIISSTVLGTVRVEIFSQTNRYIKKLVPIVVLICISLGTNDIELQFMYMFLAICFLFCELSVSFAYFFYCIGCILLTDFFRGRVHIFLILISMKKLIFAFYQWRN